MVGLPNIDTMDRMSCRDMLIRDPIMPPVEGLAWGLRQALLGHLKGRSSRQVFTQLKEEEFHR